MPHSLIVGMTESGKTTLATELAHGYRARGVNVIVLDPLADDRWEADFWTDEPDEFLMVVQHPETRRCAVFIDESGEMVGQYEREMFWLATRARHYGHNSHFITQRSNQLTPTVRDQCSYLFMFCCSFNDSKSLAEQWNREELRNAHALRQGEYIQVNRFGVCERKQLWKIKAKNSQPTVSTNPPVLAKPSNLPKKSTEDSEL